MTDSRQFYKDRIKFEGEQLDAIYQSLSKFNEYWRLKDNATEEETNMYYKVEGVFLTIIKEHSETIDELKKVIEKI